MTEGQPEVYFVFFYYIENDDDCAWTELVCFFFLLLPIFARVHNQSCFFFSYFVLMPVIQYIRLNITAKKSIKVLGLKIK